jgi:nucleoside-diphosphate-sugar epimerase
MIVGSGMLARAFSRHLANAADILVYAAGVSNSGCRDNREFAREAERLERHVAADGLGRTVVYFSTCSVDDPDARDTVYVGHKVAMEERVRRHPSHLVLRLPQVVGRTPNPHTLLNYLHARIARGERFEIWTGARRNVIDVDDVVGAVVAILGLDDASSARTLNIANSRSYSVHEIVTAVERVTGKRAIFDEVARGAEYTIDITQALPSFAIAGVRFDDDYLDRVVRKYYG